MRISSGYVPMLALAEAETARVLVQADVRIRFERLRTARYEEPQPRCVLPAPDVHTIDMEILDQTPLWEHPGAFAYAKPYARSGVRIVIFRDRVEALNRGPKLLGHVIAHEIVHMLLGTPAHTESGLMRERWSERDLDDLRWRPLPMTPGDIEMIHTNLLVQDHPCTALLSSRSEH